MEESLLIKDSSRKNIFCISLLVCILLTREKTRNKTIGQFIVVCLGTKPLSGSEAQDDLVLIQTLLLPLVVMLISFWSLSCQGHHKPRLHTEAWFHFTEL